MTGLDADLLERLSADRALASVVLFEHRHPQAEAPMHVAMMDLFRSADELVEIEAFREAGKTTKAEEHIILAGAFRNFRYGLLVGETYEKACQRMSAIDLECRSNRALLTVFGGGVLARKSNENKIWFASGAVLQAVGWEQELQSFKEGTDRPDFALLDDVENKERVRDSAAVDVSMDKLYDELLPAMDQTRMKVINAQTRLAEDCMVVRLSNDPNWLYRGYPICNGDPEDPRTESNWPARYPMEWIRKAAERYRASGKLDSFQRVYMLQAVNPESKPFREDMLAAIDVPARELWMPRFVVYDPARTTNTRRTKEAGQSDRYGKIAVSKLGSRILVHESGGFFWKPSEMIADLFTADERHQPVKIGIETNSLNDWLMEPIRIEMLRRGKMLPIKGLTAPQDRSKDDFILGLQPFANAHDIVLVGGKLAHPQLVAEWVNWPHGPRDILNAFAYALRMFGGIPVYEDFSGANIGEAPAPRSGEAVYVGFNATPAAVVAVAAVLEGRRLCVAADASATGAIADAVKTLVFQIRTAFPRAKLQAWVPAETFDQWQRIALVPALRAERMNPYRGEHIALARGGLSERIRNTWHNKRLLVVDKTAKLTLNALSAGYCFAAEKGGRSAQEPESGLSRTLSEALECMAKRLDDQGEEGELPQGANIGRTADGRTYISALGPRR